MNVEKEMKVKYEKDKQTYNLYQGLIARDKELYSLELDVYDLKCAVLKLIDGDAPLPPKPKYTPLPELDIQEPSPPIFFGQWHNLFKILPSRKTRKMSPVSQERRRTEAALRGIEKFKDLLRKKVESKRNKHVTLLLDESGSDSDFETIEMSEID